MSQSIYPAWLQISDVVAIETNGTFVWIIKSFHQSHDGALPASRGPHQGADGAGIDRKGEAFQHFRFGSRRVTEVQVGEFKVACDFIRMIFLLLARVEISGDLWNDQDVTQNNDFD